MLWVTRSHIHLDRVASPWLIRRFVDRNAVFAFVDDGMAMPPEAVPFAVPMARLGPHDEDGSTFRKILRAYEVFAPELEQMADVVETAIAIALGEQVIPADTQQLAIALAAFSEAMTILRPLDHENLRDSAPYYDALYLQLWAAQGKVRAAPDIRTRIQTYREAVDWASLLPRLTLTPSDSPGRAVLIESPGALEHQARPMREDQA